MGPGMSKFLRVSLTKKKEVMFLLSPPNEQQDPAVPFKHVDCLLREGALWGW